jgi:hypothetical protein
MHLVADPGLAAETVEKLQDDLSEALSSRTAEEPPWQVRMTCRRLDIDEQAGTHLSPALVGQFAQRDDDVVIVLTDQPRRAETQLVVVDANRVHRVALLSLPALGGVGLTTRVRKAIVELTRELCSPKGAEPVMATLQGARRVAVGAEGQDADIRFVGSGALARLRLFTGMMRANRPWRLIPQLSGAFAGALATAAYVVVNSSIWRLSDSAGPVRLSMVMLFALTAMVVWLMVRHHLWERPVDRAARKLAAVYNAATVITLTTGVLFMYAGLLILSLAGETLLVRGGILQDALRHPVDWTDYVTVAWLASSMATIGGAIGSGLDSDEAARDAAFGYRQRRRDSDRRERKSDEGSAGLTVGSGA